MDENQNKDLDGAMDGGEKLQSNVESNETELLKNENIQLNQKVMQLMADFDNYRRRTDAEKAQYTSMGNMVLLMQLAEIKDDISFAQADANLDFEQANSMLATVKDKLSAAMQSAGLTEIEFKKDDKFEARLMEAITTIATPEEKTPGTVAEIISAGYKHAQTDQVIKTAKVVVYK